MLQLALVMMVLASALMLVGALLMILSVPPRGREAGEERVEGGAVIVVGPVPIVFGTSERIAKTVMLLAIALLVASVVAFLVLSGVAWR